MNKVAKLGAAGASTLALAGGIGAGIAFAQSEPTPATNPAATPTANPTDKPEGDRKKRGLLRRALHGEATLGGERHQVLAFQRGTVEAVSTTSMTVQSKDGFTATYGLNSETRVRKQGEQAAVSDIKLKDKVRVVATKDGSALTAMTVGDHGA
jgi:hypothetical protein